MFQSNRLFYILFIIICFRGTIRSQTNSKPDTLASVYGQEVIVTKHLEKKITGLSIGKIIFNPESASKLPSLFGAADLLKMLELTPGVQNSGDANTNLYIRGGDSGQNLLLYENVQCYTPGHLLGFFPLFNSDHLSAFELNKANIHARYGGRLSSVINVSAKKNIPEKLSVRGNIGMLASQATLELPMGKRFGLTISGRKTYTELLVQPVMDVTVNNNAKSKVENLDYDFHDVNLTLNGSLSERDKFTVNTFFGNDYLNITDEDLLFTGVMNWENATVSAQWERKTGENSFIQQIYGESYSNRLATKQEIMNIRGQSEIMDVGYKNRYLFRIEEIPFESGLQYTFHQIQPQTFNDSPSTLTAHDLSLYGGLRFAIAHVINADCGLRANVFRHDKTFFSLEPRLQFSYSQGENQTFRLSYSRQNQYMTRLTPTSIGFPMDFWVAASRNLPPQSGNEFSAGYFRTFKNSSFEFSGEIYYRNMHRLNEYVQIMTEMQNRYYGENIHIGNGRAYGLELIVKKNFGRLTGWISYTLGRSERIFEDMNQGKVFPARFDRRHDLSLVASYTFSDEWDASLVYVYATGNAYTLPSSWYFIGKIPVKEYGSYNGARMPDYNRTDLSINYWYKKDNGIIFSIYNMFMVSNPVYVFMNVKQDEENGKIKVDVKQKRLYTIIPSVSWRFRF
ncbi:MAG: TonB-dependent receptor [Prevotellaceae bacterium]|jgi:hypothetical protein|nr:TonB-dependent receptor [Prevotellaceae bacterium]